MSHVCLTGLRILTDGGMMSPRRHCGPDHGPLVAPLEGRIGTRTLIGHTVTEPATSEKRLALIGTR
jgi:hypothetical protein